MSLLAEHPVRVAPERPDWMTDTDETILVTMLKEGNMTPRVIAEVFDICNRRYASNELSAMVEEGYVERVGTGLYRLTETGCEYAKNADAEVPPSGTDDTGRA
jgi:predicted transcriptional regulator